MKDTIIEKLVDVYNKKGYKFFTSPFSVNVFGVRLDTDTNLFDDYLGVAYYDDKNNLIITLFEATTDPGKHWLMNPMRKSGCAIMVAGQYRGAFKLGGHGRTKYLAGRQFKEIPVYRDANGDSKHDMDPSTIETGVFYTNIHHGWSAATVNKNSAGCQVIKSKTRFEKEFIPILKKSTKKYGATFTYTLFEKKDFM